MPAVYRCSVCSAVLTDRDGWAVRQCSCDGPIIGELESNLFGVGGVK